MHRDPATHPDSDGSDLAILNPNACLPFAIPGFDAEAVHQMDHRVLQTSQIGMQILAPSLEVQNWIADELAGAVIGGLAAAINLKDRVRQIRRVASTRLVE